MTQSDVMGKSLKQNILECKIRCIIIASKYDEIVPFEHSMWIYENMNDQK